MEGKDPFAFDLLPPKKIQRPEPTYTAQRRNKPEYQSNKSIPNSNYKLGPN
jgi:hypothetical protein